MRIRLSTARGCSAYCGERIATSLALLAMTNLEIVRIRRGVVRIRAHAARADGIRPYMRNENNTHP